MKSSVKKILAILAAMKCWVVITPAGTPQRRQKAHTSVSICLSNLVKWDPIQLTGIPKRAVHPTLSEYLGAAE